MSTGAAICHELLPPDEVILGRSVAMNDVRNKLKKVACTDVPVLIRGEAGTGKEMLARLIHRMYPGETTPFHKVIPAGQDGWRKVDSFVAPRDKVNGNGHAHHNLPGKPACIGSLFFEEIAELNFASQRKLAHLLHDDRSIGHSLSEYCPSLLRMICATRHDIETKMTEGNFREDLFYSVNVVSLYLPSLRSRREDIPTLVEYFWESYRKQFDSSVPRPSGKLMEVLQTYGWPGNMRELADVMKQYVQSSSEKKIVNYLAASASPSLGSKPCRVTATPIGNLAKQDSQEIERKIIFRTLQETRWNRKRAARALNISYRTLLYKIKEAGLPSKSEVVKRERQN